MLKRFFKGEDEGEIFGTAPGDLGVIFIAAMVTLAGLLYLFSPSPFARLERAQARQAQMQALAVKAAKKKAIDDAVASGEVGVSIYPAKRP